METTAKGIQDKTTGGTETTRTSPTTSSTNVQTGQAARTGAATQTSGQQAGTQRGEGRVEQAKETLSNAYEQTSRTLNQTYNQALDYGRENPGTALLIAFGAGVGVGLLLAGGIGSRSRTSRIVPPVMNAVSEIVNELLR